MIVKILGYLLHHANSDISYLTKSNFYAIKNYILQKYGLRTTTDIQHIRKECYTCEGTGSYTCSYKLPEKCWDCYGTGVYEEYWAVLDVYTLGKYHFHLPVKKVLKSLMFFTNIEGYIHHRPSKNNLGRECMLWLYLFYDFDSFKTEFGKNKSLHSRTPLLLVENIYYNFRLKNLFTKKNRPK